MAKVRSLGDYLVMHNADESRLNMLHTLSVEVRDSFFSVKAVQNLLLNHGDEIPDSERPKSFLGLHDACWKRSGAALQLLYLEHVIDAAIRPQIVVQEAAGLWTPGKKYEKRVVTATGHDAGRIEQLQQHWLTDSELSESVRSFQRGLQEAFDEYNLKYVLGRMFQSQKHQLPKKARAEAELQKRVIQAAGRDEYLALDDAYYRMGNRFYQGCADLYKKLSRTQFGMMFILLQEELTAEISRIRASRETQT
jgi:hypothetical protein